MKSLENTQTGKNLLKAFAGETQARARYEFFSDQAKQDGYVQISDVFKETADNEKEHAKRFFALLLAGYNGILPTEIEIVGDYPVNKDTTLENLKNASKGEGHESSDVYPSFAKIANEEGFTEIAHVFLAIAVAEKHHQERFNILAKNLEEGKVFKKDKKVIWKCSNCGYLHEGLEAATVCPSCDEKQEYFELFSEAF